MDVVAPEARTGPTPPRERRRRAVAGLVLGAGLGGFVDGIVLHQILQWHHMLTDREGTGLPPPSVRSLEENTRWDGLFHAATWLLVVAGLALLWPLARRGRSGPGRVLVGLLLAGWGLFNLVEGIVDHHILTVHHVRDDVADPLPWDLGFLLLGVALLAGGTALARGDRRPATGAP